MQRLTGLALALLASASLFTLLSCSTGPHGTTTLPPPGNSTAQIVVPQNNVTPNPTAPSQVLFFPADATGNPAPTSSIALPSSLEIIALATDPSGNIYVLTNADLRVYAANANGTATPIRLIPAVTATTLPNATRLAADSTGQIYVVEPEAIAVFSSTANGAVAPSRLISGSATSLYSIQSIAVDAQGNIYVLNSPSTGSDSILVFGPTATGNVAPIRTITGANTGLPGPSPGGSCLTVDPAGDIYVGGLLNINSNANGGIAIFAPGANGNAAPTRVLTLGDTILWSIGLDASNNIYVVEAGGYFDELVPLNPTVARFAADASGTPAPASRFTSSVWTGPDAIAIQTQQ